MTTSGTDMTFFLLLLSLAVCWAADHLDHRRTAGRQEKQLNVPSVQSWLTPLEIQREPAGQGDKIRFRIRFKATGSGTVRWVEDDNPYVGEQQTISASSEVQEVSYTMKTNFDTIYVAFTQDTSSTDRANNLLIELANGQDTEVQISNIVLPTFQIDPPGDLVYEEGHNVTAQIKVSSAGFEDAFPPNFVDHIIRFRAVLVDQDSGDVHSNYDLAQVISATDKRDGLLVTVEFNTASLGTSGLVTVEVRTPRNNDQRGIVRRIRVIKDIILRPSTQAGPFPDGFIGFMSDPWDQIQNDTVRQSCDLSRRCNLWCLAVGEHLSDMSLVKVDSDGTRSQVSPSSSERYEYTLAQRLEIPSTSAGSSVYQCRVVNSQGQLKVRTFQVTYKIPVDILDDQSEIVLVSSDSSIRQLAIVCTVRAYPAPNITFTVFQESKFQYNVEPDELTQDDDNVFTAKKFVTFDTADPYGYQGQYKGKLNSASCNAGYIAYQEGYHYGDSDYHSFTVEADLG